MTDRTRRELLNLQEELPEAVKDCEKSVLEDNPDLSKSEAIAICRDQLDMEAADDDCPEGEVQVGERCIDITTVEDVPPSVLNLEVPDNAVSIDSPGEAPENAEVIQGPQGGTYYVPGGGEEGEGDGGESDGSNNGEDIDGIDDVSEETADNAREITSFADNIEVIPPEKGEIEGVAEIQFEPDVPSEKRNLSALGYNPDTDEYDDGVIRYGEIDVAEGVDDLFAGDQLNLIADEIGRPEGDFEISMGHFTSNAPHVRIDGGVDADEMNDFMEDFNTAINEFFYPYEGGGGGMEEIEGLVEDIENAALGDTSNKPSNLNMSNHRILANRTLAGPIKRVEMDDGRVKYEDVALLDSGVWTDAGSGEPTEYDPAELEVAEENSVNIMHDSESDASEAGHINAESYHVEDGTGYADVVLDTSKSAGEYADETLQETLESNGKVGFGGPSIEIPAEGYDLEREGEGYPKLVNGTIEGLGFVRDPASKSTSFAHQTAQRGVAMSAAEDSPTLTVYTREGRGMSDKTLADAATVREVLEANGIDTEGLSDEEAKAIGESLMDEYEEDDENGEDEGPPDDDVENEDKDDEEEEEDKENEGGDVEEEIQALWDELEALKDGMMAEEDAQDLADAEEVADLREDKQALADANEELEKRLEALEDEPTDPKSLADAEDDDDLEPVWDDTPSELTGW